MLSPSQLNEQKFEFRPNCFCPCHSPNDTEIKCFINCCKYKYDANTTQRTKKVLAPMPKPTFLEEVEREWDERFVPPAPFDDCVYNLKKEVHLNFWLSKLRAFAEKISGEAEGMKEKINPPESILTETARALDALTSCGYNRALEDIQSKIKEIIK